MAIYSTSGMCYLHPADVGDVELVLLNRLANKVVANINMCRTVAADIIVRYCDHLFVVVFGGEAGIKKGRHLVVVTSLAEHHSLINCSCKLRRTFIAAFQRA